MKRILTLDGGGIRGVFSLQILARIEELFRKELNKPNLVLADVFDFVAGTSTGAIIAAFVSWGVPVRQIEHQYISRGAEMFAREPWFRRWKAKYRADAIARFFQEFFSEGPGKPALLGTDKLRTKLLVVVRNASAGSPWPVSNNPAAIFNDPSLPACNLNIPLWQLLRASAAAPSYFPPQEITLAGRTDLFVDGGMTPYNNPALISVLMATLPGYRLCWPATRQEYVISVGTGLARARLPRKFAAQVSMLDHIKYIAPALIGSTAVEQDVLCRVLGDCVHGDPIDSEVGALTGPALLSRDEQKFTYARYDRPLDETSSELLRLSKIATELDNLLLIPLLQQEGQQYAAKTVQREHLFPRE